VNRDSTTSERTQITMKYVDNPGNVGYVSGPTSPEDIPPGGVARFYLPLPKGTFVQNWEFSIEALPVGDDDPLQVEASELMASIEGFKSEKASGGGRLFDVQDLYLALKKDFGGRARAANGLDAVDAIFISHGFFADLNGNGQHDGAIDPEGSCLPQIQKATLTAGKAKVVEEIGMTSYCQKGTHEAVIPRYSPADLPKESTAIVDTGGVQARALVLITFPPQSGRAGYGYFFDPDPAGKVSLAMPPRESEATMILLMLADGYAPAVAAEIKSADFWAQADKSPGKSFLSYQVNLKLGELTRSSSPLTSPLSFYLAGGVILVAVSLGILVFLRFHRRSASQD
ncbi:MAG: hypothetical protein Q7O66_04875, partial [Dehalococcoidia bacterium]|nr:hypothetical protein [Dehalococcoidia bacterium]